MWLFLTAILFCACIHSGSAAYAYLDPGSGSMLLQAILGGTAGIAVLVAYTWKQILAFLPFKFPSKPAASSQNTAEPEMNDSHND